MQLTTHAISKLALSALTMGCVLILSGCGNSPARSSVPSVPPTPVTPGNPTNPTIQPSPPQPTNIPNDTLKLRFSSGGVVHEGKLTINGDSGKLLTSFFDINSNKTATVEQTIKPENTSKGLALWGYDPVYPGTQTPYPNYIPDNFILGVNPDGSTNLKTCDDADNCSDVEIIDN